MSQTNEPLKTAALQTATFACGCFWGVESKFQQIEGVVSTDVGYTGGTSDAPTYKSVCSGGTGHAEAVEIIFDPAIVSYSELLERFFSMHDPTDTGDTHGGQYRAAIFYHSSDQEVEARKFKERIEADCGLPVTTQIAPAVAFFRAEEYHQDYYKKNGGGFC